MLGGQQNRLNSCFIKSHGAYFLVRRSKQQKVQIHCYGLNWVLPSYVEVLIPSTEVFGGGPFGKKFRLGEVMSARSLCWDIVPYKKTGRQQSICSLSEDTIRRWPGRELPLGTKSASTLILDFQFPDLWEINVYPLRAPSLCYFVIAAWAN